MEFTAERQGWFSIQVPICKIHHVNRLKKKHHVTMSVDAEKASYIIQDSFMIYILRKPVIEERFLSLVVT